MSGISRPAVAKALTLPLIVIIGAGCTSSVPASPEKDFDTFVHLLAQISVVEELETMTFDNWPFQRTYRGLSVTVDEIHWVGAPRDWLSDPPVVEKDDLLEVLAAPGLDYEVGQTYLAGLTFHTEWLGYEWDLAMGLDSEGRVITQKNRRRIQELLRIGDESDGDVDEAEDLWAELANEMEERLNTNSAQVPFDEYPKGPLLQAMYPD